MGSAAPTLLFVPGLVSDETVWKPAADLLGAQIQVAFADVTAQATITAMAEHLLAVHSGPLLVAGHSMGGRVALEMARLAPGRIAGLALFDTGTHPKRDGEEGKRQHFIRLANEQGMAALNREWLPPMLAPSRVADRPFVASLEAMVMRMTPVIHERQLRALLGRPDAFPGLADIRCPVLVAVGRQDSWSPLAQHEQMAAALPDAQLVVIEDAGHFAPVEQPVAAAAALSAWLATIKETAMLETDKPLPATPLLDRAHARTGYNINKMAMGLMDPANRAAFRDDESAYLDRFGLTPDEKAAVLSRDWQEMVRLGGNLFFILKISAVDPTPITQIGADQAGMEHTEFLTKRLGKKING